MDLPGFRSQQARAPTERFVYLPASNGDLSVSVASVVGHADPDFIPSDPNWLQIRLTITNTGNRTIRFTEAKEQLADGTMIGSARSAGELLKPPSMVATTAGIIGVGTAGMVVGSLLFPPAALVSGAAIVLGPMFMADRMTRTVERLNREGIQAGPIAPGTSASGLLFVPAVTGQSALLIFYDVGGSQESLVVQRIRNGED
ncbi:MAG: hypothetical protein K2Y04_11635 [Caulobacteraceae bacterium]|nr:hypothetical protein [Caulobacteraceae bacterium]